MTLKELKKNFIVQSKLPHSDDFISKKYYSATHIIVNKKVYYIVFTTKQNYLLYESLTSPSSYKTKEKLFGVHLDKGYAYAGKIPQHVEIVLPNKWIIDDGKNKRELAVHITNKNKDNNKLIHELYTNTRNT